MVVVENRTVVGRERETEVILQVRKGDREQFSLLVDAYADRVFGYLMLMVKNRTDAEDLSQEVFLKAFRGLRRFRTGSPFAPWLFRIARNEALNWARRTKQTSRLTARLVSGHSDQVGNASSPDPMDTLLHKESTREARKLIAALDEKYRTALVLRYGEGMSYREISRVLSVPEGTVKTLLHRAKAKLAGNARSRVSVGDVATTEAR
jgi:RNA polymerase sigma-70 factor (ECF subfamily)